jgi:hypothetical protein
MGPKGVPLADEEHKKQDPLWTWAERVGRDGADASGEDDLDDQATARLKMLRQAAGNFAARLPSTDEWAAFLRTEIAPVFNALLTRERMCLECGKRMAAEPPPPHGVCSPECASDYDARKTKDRARPAAKIETGETAKISLGDVADVERNGKKKPKK